MIATIVVFPELGKREDWGAFALVALPSVGDTLAAKHGGVVHFLSVVQIYHLARPIQEPTGDPEVRIIAFPRRS